MKTMIRPIAVSKTISIQNKTIGNKKSILNSNIKFASQIISKHSSVGAYDFNFDSFVFLNLSEENVHKVVRAADCVIDLFITMNHFNGNPSLQVEYKEYFEELKGQIIYYLNQLQVWSEHHYQYFQLLYKQISSRFLGEENQKDRQMFEKQLFQVKSQLINWRETLANKREKGKEPNSLSRPFYQMMYQFMQSKKTLNYKEIWKLSIPSQLRLGIEKQKHQYMKHWNAMDSREQEIIGCLFATHKITSYLPNQILSMKEAEWIQFVGIIKTSAKEYYDGTIQNNVEFMRLKLINRIRETDGDEFQNEIIQLIHHNSRLSQMVEKLKKVEHGESEKVEHGESEKVELSGRIEQQEKLIEFIENLETKECELLLSDFNKYSIEKGMEKYIYTDLLGSSENELLDSKIQFVNAVESIDKPEELQAVIHLFFQNSNRKEDIEFFQQVVKKQLETSQFQILQSEAIRLKAITESEDIVTKKQNLKELIYQMNREKWDSLFCEMINYSQRQSVKEKLFHTPYLCSIADKSAICMFENVKEKLFQTDLLGSSVSDVVGDFFERIELLSEEYKMSLQGQPEEIQTMSYKNQLLESIAITKKPEELQGMVHLLMENNLLKKEAEKFGVFQKAKIEIQKQNLTEFISYMDLKNWETLLNEIDKSRMLIQDSQGVNFHTDLLGSSVKENHFHTPYLYSIAGKPEICMFGSVKAYETQSAHMHSVKYQITEEESRKNKTQFLDFLEMIENTEELQNIVHILLQDEHLKNQAQSIHLLEMGQNEWKRKITGDKEYEYREVDLAELNHESLILYKQNLKELIRDMDLKNWETLLNDIDKNRMQSQDSYGVDFHTDLTKNKTQFLDFMETIESAEELQNIVHLLLQDEHLKNQAQSFHLLEMGQNEWKRRITGDEEYEYREVDLAELNHESLILYKQNFKKLIRDMDLKNWETLLNKIEQNRMQSQNSYGIDFHTDLTKNKTQFLDFLETIESAEELQNIVHILLQDEHLKNQAQSIHLLEMGQNEWKGRITGDEEYEYREVDLAELNHESLILYKQNFKKIIQKMDLKNWETLLNDIDKNRMQSQDSQGVNFFTDLLGSSVKAYESQNSRLHRVKYQITEDKEYEYREVDLAELNHESLILYKQNLKKIIQKMDLKNWETLHHEISTKENHLHTDLFDQYIGQFSHMQEGRYELTEAVGDRAKFLDFLEAMDSTQEIQKAVGFLLQNEYLKGQVQRFNMMEIVQSEAPQIERSDIETGYKELKLLERSQESLILQKDKLKVDFFQPYMLKTFFEQIEMFSEENRDNSEEQTKGLRNSIAKAKFLNSVEVMESQEELQTLVHFVMGNPNMKEVAERFGLLKNGSVKAESNQENIMAKKQKLKSFISDLDSEKWEVLYGELRDFKENIVQIQGLSGVIKDYFSRIELFNGKFKDALSSQTEEIRMLSYKTQFLESIGGVEKPEELQSLIHFMTQDTQLEKRTEAFKVSLSKEMEKIGHQEDFIVQKYNLKEWVGYMDSTKWINLYHRMENYNHDTINKKGKAEEPILSTYLFKQYRKQVYHMQGYKNTLKQLQQLTEQKGEPNTKKIVNMEKFLEMRRRSEISLYMKSSFDELQEEHSFLTFYQPTQLVATQPVSAYNRRHSNIVPENMTGDIRRIETTMQERVEDIGRIVKQNHSIETTADFSKQLKSIVDKMELYHKEMEQIKSCQSKLLQSTNSNQIVNKVMKQLQGQLKVERMRRGLDR